MSSSGRLADRRRPRPAAHRPAGAPAISWFSRARAGRPRLRGGSTGSIDRCGAGSRAGMDRRERTSCRLPPAARR